MLKNCAFSFASEIVLLNNFFIKFITGEPLSFSYSSLSPPTTTLTYHFSSFNGRWSHAKLQYVNFYVTEQWRRGKNQSCWLRQRTCHFPGLIYPICCLRPGPHGRYHVYCLIDLLMIVSFLCHYKYDSFWSRRYFVQLCVEELLFYTVHDW